MEAVGRVCGGEGGAHGFLALAAEGLEVEASGWCTVVGAEGAGEVRAGGEAAVERDLGEGGVLTVGEEVDGALEAEALDEGGEGLAHEDAEDAVEVEWGEGGGAGDVFEAQGLGEVLGDVVDSAVDAGDVV
jgi:hypothetical protein